MKWDGRGKALDIGSGGGPVAILLARHPESSVKCIDYWGTLDVFEAEMCEEREVGALRSASAG